MPERKIYPAEILQFCYNFRKQPCFSVTGPETACLKFSAGTLVFSRKRWYNKKYSRFGTGKSRSGQNSRKGGGTNGTRSYGKQQRVGQAVRTTPAGYIRTGARAARTAVRAARTAGGSYGTNPRTDIRTRAARTGTLRTYERTACGTTAHRPP